MKSELGPHHGELEIEKVRAPFKDVMPTRIMKTRQDTSGKLLIAGSPEINAEFPRMRAEMLQQVFALFVTRLDEIDGRVSVLTKGGFRPTDAVFTALVSLFESSLRQASTSDPSFMQKLRSYDIAHAGRGFALGVKSGAGELINFTTHGTGVMMGLYRVVPFVFASTYGRMPTTEELRVLIPECVERIFNALTRVTGAFAVRVEEQMGMQLRYLGYEHSTYALPEFQPRKFALRSVEGRHVLDVTEEVTIAVEDRVSVKDTKYHGCLSGLVKAPQSSEGGPPPTVFAYMKNLTADLMFKHVYTNT